MSLYLVVPLLAFFALVQTTLAPQLPVGGARPDLLLVIVVAWGATSQKRDAVRWGLIGGFWLDLFSGLPFGTQTIALGLLGLVADMLESNFFRTSILTPLATIVIASLLYQSIALGLLQLLGYTVNWPQMLARVMLPAALFNVALMPLLYGGLRWIARSGTVELGI